MFCKALSEPQDAPKKGSKDGRQAQYTRLKSFVDSVPVLWGHIQYKPVLFACESLSLSLHVFMVSLENEMGPKGLKENVEETNQ